MGTNNNSSDGQCEIFTANELVEVLCAEFIYVYDLNIDNFVRIQGNPIDIKNYGIQILLNKYPEMDYKAAEMQVLNRFEYLMGNGKILIRKRI